MTSAQSLDTTLVSSPLSAFESSVFEGTTQFNGQPSVFVTMTRPSTTTTSTSSTSTSKVPIAPPPSSAPPQPPPPPSPHLPPPTAVPPPSPPPTAVPPPAPTAVPTGLPTGIPTGVPSPPNPTFTLPPISGGGPPGLSTGYTVGTAVGGSVGGLLILSLLIFWFRAHNNKKKKLRLSVSKGSAQSNKLEEEKTENVKANGVPERKPLPMNSTASGTGTATHVRKLDGGRTLKSTNTL